MPHVKALGLAVFRPYRFLQEDFYEDCSYIHETIMENAEIS